MFLSERRTSPLSRAISNRTNDFFESVPRHGKLARGTGSNNVLVFPLMNWEETFNSYKTEHLLILQLLNEHFLQVEWMQDDIAGLLEFDFG